MGHSQAADAVTVSTVLVTGASGLLGSNLFAAGAAARYRLRGTSRRAPAASTSANGIEWVRADLLTGEGLDAATDSVDVVIHAASSPARDTQRTDVEGTKRLLASARSAGVRHLIHVSIVGVDRIPVAYYKHKLAAEGIVQAGAVPWTIVRGTQFHDFVDTLCRQMTRLPFAIVPAGFRVQPVDVREFAAAIWRLVDEQPSFALPVVGGPAVLTYRELVGQWLTAQGIRKRILDLPLPGEVAAALRRGEGTSPTHAVGRVTWREWLRGQYGSAPPSGLTTS